MDHLQFQYIKNKIAQYTTTTNMQKHKDVIMCYQVLSLFLQDMRKYLFENNQMSLFNLFNQTNKFPATSLQCSNDHRAPL